MSDFWSKRLAPAAPPAAPAAPQQPATRPAAAAPWWQPPSTQNGAQQPQPVAPQQPLQPAYSGSVQDPNEQVHIGQLWAQEQYTTTKARSNDGASCPECDSPNFLRIRGAKNAPRRCFECGYNEIGYQHELAGISATSDEVPTYTARVQRMTTNNFHPQEIVGRVT